MRDRANVRFFKGHSTKEKFARSIFVALCSLAFLIGVICTVNALNRTNQTFAGFLLNQRMVCGNVGQMNWTGTQAGLKFPDQILKVDGIPVKSIKHFDEVLSAKAPGEKISYTVLREGATVSLSVPTMLFSVLDFFLLYGAYLIAASIYLVIGVVVFVLKPNTRVSWTFFTCCLLVSIYYLTAFEMSAPHLGLVKLYFAANIFIPAAVFHFSSLFPDEKNFAKKYPLVLAGPYVFSTVLASIVVISYPTKSLSVFILNVILPNYVLVSAIALILSLLVALVKKGAQPITKQRAKVILLGAGVAFPLPIFILILSSSGTNLGNLKILNNLLIFPILIFPATIAYSIAKHNLFDVDVYIKRTVGYAIMTVVVGATYFAIQLGMKNVILEPLLGKAAENIYPVVFALLIVFFFNPVNKLIQNWVDRLFYRAKFDYKNTITSVSNALTSVFNLEEVLQKIISTVKQEMFIDSAGLILLAEEENSAQFYFSGNPETVDFKKRTIQIGSEEPLLDLLAEKKELITRYDIAEDPKYADIKQGCEKRFEQLGATLAVPLVYQDDLIGVMSLGTKKSGHFYSRDDISLIETLASQSAIAIKNAKLFEENIEKTRMEEELKIAHDIQIGMLPETLPDLDEITFAATCFPAQEVGGDFFDFIESGSAASGDRKVDIIVGDVSGKAVSGALVMAASRSIFRILSEGEGTVSDIMKRANVRLKYDIKKGMFVALAYASLDPVEKRFILVNAGQTQPILLPRDGSDPHFIENDGDRFPLGIVDDCDYQEISVQLVTGDMVVFYTDGIVEAMNEEDELYGFERFIEVIEKNRALDVNELQVHLMADVTDFVGDAVQHDDLTLVILQVN